MIGAILGAIIGFLILRNIWGAVLGGVIGWLLTAGRVRHRRTPPVGDFLAPLFAVLGAVAKADGRVSESEIAVAERLMARLNLTAEQRHTAIEGFNQGKQADFDVDAAMAQLRQWTAGRHDHAITIIDVVLETVLAEGPSEAKLELLRRLAATLHISQMELMALMAMKGYAWSPGGAGGGGWQGWQGAGGYTPPRRAPSGPDPYSVLGVATAPMSAPSSAPTASSFPSTIPIVWAICRRTCAAAPSNAPARSMPPTSASRASAVGKPGLPIAAARYDGRPEPEASS